ASAKSAGVNSVLATAFLLNPRKTCERITPEFPRAPISNPFARACESSPTLDDVDSETYFAPLANERLMLVPVSPSGTGKTFNELINSALLFNRFELTAIILRNSFSVIFEIFNLQNPPWYPSTLIFNNLYALNDHVNCFGRYPKH